MLCIQTAWPPRIWQLSGSSGHRAPHQECARDKGNPKTPAAACALWWSSSWQSQPLCAHSGNGRDSGWSSAYQPRHKVQNFAGSQDLNKTKVIQKWAQLEKKKKGIFLFEALMKSLRAYCKSWSEWLQSSLAQMSRDTVQKVVKIPRFHKLYQPCLIRYFLHILHCGEIINKKQNSK